MESPWSLPSCIWSSTFERGPDEAVRVGCEVPLPLQSGSFALRFSWQSGCSSFAHRSVPGSPRTPVRSQSQTLYPGRIHEEVLQWPSTSRTTKTTFSSMSKRRHGYPSESRVKRGDRVVHGNKELIRKAWTQGPVSMWFRASLSRTVV